MKILVLAFLLLASCSEATAQQKPMVTGVNTWFLQPGWGFGTPYASENVDFATAFRTGSNIWKLEFIKDIKAYGGVLRLMDWNGTNFSRVKLWAQRRQPTDKDNYSIYVPSDRSEIIAGLAYEWQFDLCARTQQTCWITLPIMADDDYLKQFAKLAKQRLAPGLSLIVELSNEVDGGWFGQSDYAYQQGELLGLPGDNKWYKGGAWQTYRTLAVHRALRAEFGNEAMGKRVIVGRCTVGNTDLMRESLTSVYKSKWNPNNEKIDMICMSAYFGDGRDGNTYTLADAKHDIDERVNGNDGFKAVQKMQHSAGIPLLGVYEGGVHVQKNAGRFSVKSEAGQAISYLLEQSSPYFDVFAFYAYASPWPNKDHDGAWGLKESYGGSETSKSLALKSWTAKQRAPKVAAR
jgi:hypothetical protein